MLPSNEGRGYVLRRIIRRAIRHFWKLGALQADGQFWRMVQPLVEMMGDAYPELTQQARRWSSRRCRPKKRRSRKPSMPACMRLENALAASGGSIDGEQLFQLHDTYGCPPDLIARHPARARPGAGAWRDRLSTSA